MCSISYLSRWELCDGSKLYSQEFLLVHILWICSSVRGRLWDRDVKFSTSNRTRVDDLPGRNGTLVNRLWLLREFKKSKSGMVFARTAVNNWMGCPYPS